DRLLEPVTVLVGGTATDLGVAARAQAAGERLADPDAVRGHRSAERLGIGVARDEIDVARPGTDHRVDGVAAASPDADDADRPRLHAPPEPTEWPGKEAEGDQHGNPGDDDQREAAGQAFHAPSLAAAGARGHRTNGVSAARKRVAPAEPGPPGCRVRRATERPASAARALPTSARAGLRVRRAERLRRLAHRRAVAH